MNLLVIAALAVVGGLAMWIYRGTTLKAPIPIGTLVLVLLLGYVSFTHDRASTAQKRHDDCVARVERSLGSRVMWTAVGAKLTARGFVDFAEFIQTELDKNLPTLSVADCPKA